MLVTIHRATGDLCTCDVVKLCTCELMYVHVYLSPFFHSYKDKERAGTVTKIDPSQPDHVVFVEGLFSKEADLSQFRGLRIETSSGDWGVIEGTYGTEGLLKVKFKDGLPK